MTNKSPQIYGISVEEWQSAYRPGIQEFGAMRFVVKRENELIRIAFGNNGPPLNEQGLNGCAVYSHAVMMTSALALDLSKALRNVVAGSSASQA